MCQCCRVGYPGLVVKIMKSLAVSMDGWLGFNGILSTQVAAIGLPVCCLMDSDLAWVNKW